MWFMRFLYILKKSKVKKWSGLLISLAVLLHVLLIYFMTPDIIQLFEIRLLDARIQSIDYVPPSDTIKLIMLDRESRSEFGMDSDMRFALSKILDDLCEKKAKVIGLDLFFSPTENPEEDGSRIALAKAMDRCGNVVVGYRWDIEFGKARLAKAEYLGRHELFDAARSKNSKGFYPENLPSTIQRPDNFLINKAKAAGYYTVLKDPDGIVRKIASNMKVDNIHYFPFSLAITRVFLEKDEYTIESNDDQKLSLAGDVAYELNMTPDSSGYLWLRYFGPRGSFETINFNDAYTSGISQSLV